MIVHADKKRKKSIKLLAYGDSNVGKTDFSLRTTPRPILVFDTEQGTDLFEGRKGFEFDYWTDKDGNKNPSIKELRTCIEFLKTIDGKKYNTFVLDNITDLWDYIQSQRSEYKDGVAKAKGKNLDNRNEAALETFNQRDWADCKKIYKDIMFELKNLSQNVIVNASEKEISENKPDGSIVRTGEYTYEAEKSTKKAFDYSLRLVQDSKTGARSGIIVKSRGEDIAALTKIENPTWDIFTKTIEGMKNAPEATPAVQKKESIFSEGEDEFPELDDAKKRILVLCGELKEKKEKELMELLEKTIHAKNPNIIKDLGIAEDLLEKLENMKKENN